MDFALVGTVGSIPGKDGVLSSADSPRPGKLPKLSELTLFLSVLM